MTSANVFNLNSVSQNQNLNANAATSKTKAGNSGAAAVFSSMMNANYSTNQTVNANSMSQASIKTNDTDRTQNSYTQYSYRDRGIASAKMNDKLDEAADTLNSFEDKVVTKIAEDLGVDEDAVRAAMENLGLTAFGLMDPQNLAQLMVQLTDAASPEDLLFQPQFVDLMQEMQVMQAQLADELNLMPDEMQDLLAQMEIVDDPQAMEDGSFADVVSQVVQENEQATVVSDNEAVQPQDDTADMEIASEQTPDMVEKVMDRQTAQETKQDGSNADDLTKRENEVQTADRTNAHAAGQAPDMVFTTDQVMEETIPQTEDTSYLSIDTMDLIEQFAENVRVTISEETSSMEMQLNPENLGKVYLQVSSEQGMVRAQIAASEEAVKTALETQVAELKETLLQSGIKVDSIEVTVASHEFERNLEQGQNREFEEGQRQQEQQSQRRNINLSSLDELSSLMTEEETLVAQMMRDNGNSVDLTA